MDHMGHNQDGQDGQDVFEILKSAASWAHVETVFAGIDPRPFMPGPVHECSPFEVFAACIDALDVDAVGMTEARFVEICVDEGFPEEEAVNLWAMRPMMTAKLTEGRVRRVCRKTLRELGMQR